MVGNYLRRLQNLRVTRDMGVLGHRDLIFEAVYSAHRCVYAQVCLEAGNYARATLLVTAIYIHFSKEKST